MPNDKKPYRKRAEKGHEVILRLTLDEPEFERFKELIANGKLAADFEAAGINPTISFQGPDGEPVDWRGNVRRRREQTKNDGLIDR